MYKIGHGEKSQQSAEGDKELDKARKEASELTGKIEGIARSYKEKARKEKEKWASSKGEPPAGLRDAILFLEGIQKDHGLIKTTILKPPTE